MKESAEPIEAAFVGMVGFGIAEMPFANEAGLITDFLESFDTEGFGEFESVFGSRREVVAVTEALLVAPGHEAGSGGGADRACHVGIGEAGSGFGNAINVRSEIDHLRSTVGLKAKVGVARVVRVEDNDVGVRCRERSRGDEKNDAGNHVAGASDALSFVGA